jgi:hypothetical protein
MSGLLLRPTNSNFQSRCKENRKPRWHGCFIWQRHGNSNCFPVFSERQDFSVADTPSCVYLKREILRSRSSSSLRCNIRLFKSATIGSSGAQCRNASAISSSSDCCRRSRFTTSSVFRKSSHSRRRWSQEMATDHSRHVVYRER